MKFLFTILFSSLVCLSSYGQKIKYHDVSPDTTVNTWNDFMVFGIDIWWHPSPEVVVKSWGDYEVLCPAPDTLPLALNSGEEISANSSGAWLKVIYRCLNCGGVVGHWKTTSDRYMAVRNKSGSGWTYGWARLSIAANGTAFTIKDYAMQTDVNAPINAGQMIATGFRDVNMSDNSFKPLVTMGKLSFPELVGSHTINIYDMNGKVVYNGTADVQSSIDVSSFNSGVYILNFSGKDYAKSVKIAITNNR